MSDRRDKLWFEVIRPHKDRDWFQVDRETARPVWGIPGASPDRRNPNLFLLHRNHLALLDAAPELPQVQSDAWTQRDAWTKARGFTLRVAQQQAIDFITRRASAVLADDMRVGKTLSALMCHNTDRGRLVVVAPLSTRAVWLGWIKRVFPELVDQIGVMVGKKFDREAATKPIVFGHYDILRHWQIAMPIGTLIFDEAHFLTKPSTWRTKAASILRLQAQCCIPLTGTPVWKLPPDFWSILNLAVPGAWGNWHEFAMRYGAPMTTGYGIKYTGVSNERELHTRLSEVMLRRRWVDVADDAPPITRSVVVAEVEDADRKKLDLLAAQLANERTNTAGNLAHYRRVVSKIKAGVTVREAQKISTERGEPVVVWTWHKEFAEQLSRMLSPKVDGDAPVWLIHGDVAPTERERRIAEWQQSTNGVLVANMAVAQVGIDLSHARVAIFAEIDYTPAVLGQAEMRTFAPTRPMDVLFVVANHFIDQRIIRALVAKLGAADPLGVGAAIDAIDAMRDAVLGPRVEGDLDRLLEDFIASAA